ncbi:MAG: hypothetical protein JWM80_5548 [Cyanobacteria bacterium RYN_339]|nr:hypothetical protein [Cyanobacteria bacterium RYN_339]
MTSRDDLKRLIDQLADGQTDRAFSLLVSLVQGEELDAETREWNEADLGGPLPPFEWGPDGPPEGKPVTFVPGVGLVVEGGKGLGC